MSKLLDALNELGKHDRGEVDPIGSFYPDRTQFTAVGLTIIPHMSQMSRNTRALRMTETFVSWASKHQPHDSNEQCIRIAGVNEQLQQAGADAFSRFQRCAPATIILREPIVTLMSLVPFLGESTTLTKRYCITITIFHPRSHDRNVPLASCGLALTRPGSLGALSLSWPPCSNSAIV